MSHDTFRPLRRPRLLPIIPSPPHERYLVHLGIFNQKPKSQDSSSFHYIQTPLSRLIMKYEDNSVAASVLLESSPVMLAPWHCLSPSTMTNGTSEFEATWSCLL
ncbi:hypothetical protein ACJIZ3_015252 [Penstemon smallii]|uniref:Uncharacterized protein n=1 Tax=Penstemon smallii TaxID=265156 RepID=A0ABD3RLY6_9LAMI